MHYRGELTLDDLLGHSADKANQRRSAADLLTLIRQHPKTAQAVSGTPDRDDGLADFPQNGSFEDAIAWIGCKLAEALALAHREGVFHRDIKPANVLVSLRSGPQLLDFNMARDPNALAQVEDRIRGGTLPYMAHEQLAAFHDASLWQEIGVRSDIYSLGLVLRELALGERTGMPLSPRAPVAEQIKVLLTQRSKPWRSLAGDSRCISHAFDAIIDKCLTFAPMGRYDSVAALAEDFQRLLDRRPLKSARNKSARERTLIRLRPLRLVVLPAIVLASLFLFRPAPTLPAIALPGVDASVVNSLTRNDLGQALESLTKESLADTDKTTPRAIVELIAQSELNPANTRSNDLINQIVQREDLDKSVAQVGGVIGQSRHLDFLILFRDFLLLQEK
ncbi:MAG: serine/threonine protein kinase, partial [Isosphaeraceae bacterium]